MLDNLQIEFALAKFAENKGKTKRALSGYKKILNLQPNHELTLRSLGELLIKINAFQEAAELFERALMIYPNNEVFHKNFTTSLIENEDIEAPFVYYQLNRLDHNDLNITATDIFACSVVRNEAVRLPFFLQYYRQKGIDKFFIVDNNSSDGTAAYLLEQSDVFLWQTPFSFKKANFGSAWFEILLRKYGLGHWVLTVDADEIFYYPEVENKSIRQLCRDLETEKKRAYPAILLDMYSDKPILSNNYRSGEDFLKVFPFFDRRFYHHIFEEAGPSKNQTFYFGGMRERVFGKEGDYLLSKIPLLKYNSDVILSGGQHFTNLPADQISDEQGCLLHFKYFNFFTDYVQNEVLRNEHACDSMQYHQYHQKLQSSGNVVFFDPKHSVRLEHSRQLIEMGAMRAIPEPEIRQADFPTITSFTERENCPFWSIKITAYRRLKFLNEVIRSVLQATANCEEAEIEVINDAAEPEIQAEIKRILDKIGQGKIKFYSPAKNLGHPQIFDLCIERSNGRWIHLLHDDDLIHPDFYTTFETAIKEKATIGAAFCRYNYINEEGTERLEAKLENETPGIIEDWLEQIAVNCLIQMPSIVVKRSTYEHLGGFCTETGSAFDWEMWKRIAAFFPVWYEPKILASFREHSEALSHELIKSGKQIAHSRKSIAISNAYLPIPQRKFLSWQANQNLGLLAVDQAKRLIMMGNKQGAEANLREALLCGSNITVTKAVKKLSNEFELAVEIPSIEI